MIYRKIYTSQAREGMSCDRLCAILDTSRRRNGAEGLTGLLIAHNNHFLQILEGEEAAVKACYARIRVDPTHDRLRLVSRQRVRARAFPDWRMGFARPAELCGRSSEALFSLYALADRAGDRAGTDARVARLVGLFLGGFGVKSPGAPAALDAVLPHA